jgi:hypothetical protein
LSKKPKLKISVKYREKYGEDVRKKKKGKRENRERRKREKT